MIKVQNSLQKITLDYLTINNGDCVYFAKTSSGAVKEFIKQHKEQLLEMGENRQETLAARHANKEQIEGAVDSICKTYAMRYLRVDQLRRSI